MPCDNLPANGRTRRSLLIALAARRDEALARWIEAGGRVSVQLVDRIVPATRAADVAQIGKALGVHDAAAVVCEPFRQWVIEDRFAGPRPAWELAGRDLRCGRQRPRRPGARLFRGRQGVRRPSARQERFTTAVTGWLAALRRPCHRRRLRSKQEN